MVMGVYIIAGFWQTGLLREHVHSVPMRMLEVTSVTSVADSSMPLNSRFNLVHHKTIW